MNLSELQKQIIANKWNAYIVTRNNMFIGQDVLEEERSKIKEQAVDEFIDKLSTTPEFKAILNSQREKFAESEELVSERSSFRDAGLSTGSGQCPRRQRNEKTPQPTLGRADATRGDCPRACE